MNPVLSNRILFILSLAGVGVAGYLTLAHMDPSLLVCSKAVSDCDAVANHPSAWGFGISFLKSIPTAAFGLLMYVGLVALSFLRAASTSEMWIRRARCLQWTMTFTGVLITGYLTYLEAYVIRAWCLWCLGSAAIIVLMFLTSTFEYLTTMRRRTPFPVVERGTETAG